MSDAEQIRRFCSALLGGPDGHGDDRLSSLKAYLWTISADSDRPTKRTRWERADDPHTIASAAVELAGRQPAEIAHVYVGTGLLTWKDAATKGEYRRATNDSVSGLVALCVDIDFAGPGHNDSKKVYPPDLDAARTVWEAVPLKPTMVVHTGNGVHVWWCLAEPWIVEDGDDPDTVRAAMYELTRDWSATLRYHAFRLGAWQIDSTFDLARVMRVPGTLNVKGERVTEPYILEMDEDARYELDDFRDHLADPEVVKSYGGVPGVMVKELPGVDLTQVWARVTSTAYRAADYTPPWLAAMLEFMPGSNLEAVWLGEKTLKGDSSPSGVDASLVRALIQTKHATTERLVEAVMCRRLRTGEKVEKVDPSRRTDYLVSTVAKIQASAQADALKADNLAASIERLRQRAETPPPPPEPPTPPDDENYDLGDYAVAEIERSVPEPPPHLVTDGATARAPEPERPPAPATAQPRPEEPAEAAVPDAPTPKLPPPDESLGHPGIWPKRHPEAIPCMETLGQLLMGERYLAGGIEVYSLELRDGGEAQKGRMILSIPTSYQWEGNPHKLYRPGRPFYCEWYRRDAFDVPKGYRHSLSRDARLTPLQVGANRDAWITVIDLLTPHWQDDSSGGDIVTQMHEWLLSYLCDAAATLEEAVAIDNRKAWITNHQNWGMLGAPEVLIPSTSLLAYVAGQPGGMIGRAAKSLLGYLDIDPVRPRMTGANGRTVRPGGWFRINPNEFDRHEWASILEVARDNLESTEKRKLRVVGGRS